MPPIKKVLCFGDSLTKGNTGMFEPYHPYGIPLQDLLASADLPVTISGIDGERTDHMVPRFRRECSGFSVTIIMGGTNDLLSAVPVQKILDNLAAMLDAAGACRVRTIVLGIPCLLGEPEHLTSKRTQLRDGLRSLAEARADKGCVFLDAAEIIAGRAALFSRDKVHLNEDGYACLAQALAPLVLRLAEAPELPE